MYEPTPEEGEFSVSDLETFLQTASPEEIDQLRQIAEVEAERQLNSLKAFGEAVQVMVQEAVEAREKSGIEGRWLEDLRQYYGSDWSLISGSAPIVAAQQQSTERAATQDKQRQTKSRILVNVTRPKTNAAMSRLADMLLPTDDRNWGLKPTPNPDLVADSQDTSTVMTLGGQDMQNRDGTPVTKAQVANKVLDDAKKRCDAMERLIDDQLVECNYNGEFRKGLWDMAVLGTMVMRGPVARTVTAKRWMLNQQTGKWEMEQQVKEVPASERVSPWNFYPDPACGGDVRNARYVVERSEFNAKTLRALRGQPSFIESELNLCLQEAPQSDRYRGERDRRFLVGEYEYKDDATYVVWMVHGEFERGMLADAGVEQCACETDEERLEAVYGCVFLCNGRVIKAHMNPVDGDDVPYDVAVYERIEGQVFGVGVPFVLRNPSRVVIAGWRMAMDNSALSGGIQVIVNKKLVEPADGSWNLSGTKVWLAKDGTDDVGKAFAVHQINSRVQEIMQVIDRALHFAEDESSMPAIMEGSQRQAPEQVGVANLLNNNANTVLRRLVKEVDDHVTDPHITRYYDFNMTNSEDESVKGDFQVDARGTSVLMVRDGQRQSLMQVGQFVLHPMLGKFHKNSGYDWLRTMYESQHIDAQAILVDESEVPAILKQMQEQPPPPPPQIEVAKIRAQVDQQELEIDKQQADAERQHQQIMLDKKLQLEYIRYANENKVSLEETKNRMIELMAIHESQKEERAVKERMQVRELQMKARMGSGI